MNLDEATRKRITELAKEKKDKFDGTMFKCCTYAIHSV